MPTAASRVDLDRHTKRTYSVFISYQHADDTEAGRQLATWLHQTLESYEVPPELVGHTNLRGELVPASLFPVFRDKEELAADADLSANIRAALERSRTMIVICSPRAVASRFVEEEIRYFKELGKSDRILALIVDGEPNGLPDQECLPLSLRFGRPRNDGTVDWTVPTEPIAADIRPRGTSERGWTSSAAYRKSLRSTGVSRRETDEVTRDYERQIELTKLKVIAGALGVPLAELTRREKAYELSKARKRARVLSGWLAAVGLLAIAAIVGGALALQHQREAQRQTIIAKRQTVIAQQQQNEAVRQRDHALREAYVNIVRRASAEVEAGQLGAARELLFNAPRANRNWEWWYLMARCGPSPMKTSELAAVFPAASTLKAGLDAVSTDMSSAPHHDLRIAPSNEAQTDNQLVIDYLPYRGRGSTTWQARRISGEGAILLNGFITGMYGELPAVLFGRDNFVCWRNRSGDGSARKPAVMASGEQVLDSNGDYVAFLRERYIVGPAGGELKKEPDGSIDLSELDLRTWPDEPQHETHIIGRNADREHEIVIVPLADPDRPTQLLDVAEATVTQLANDRREWQRRFRDMPPVPAAALAAGDIHFETEYHIPDGMVSVERGTDGPLVLSAWGFGNVRMRDGRTGRILGDSIAPPSTTHDGEYAGSAAIVPGTTLVAGWFWWSGKIIAGVVDLAKKNVAVRFEKAPDLSEGWATFVGSDTRVSPDGHEVAFELQSRNDTYFAVWSRETGKLIYGPFGTMADEAPKATKPPPLDYAWHPKGDFVAVVQPNGITELKKNFSSLPFARLDGVNPSALFRVQEVGDRDRVIVGNTVVDTERWDSVITLPVSSYISSDGELAVVEARPGVVEVVRVRSRQRLRENVLRYQILARDARDNAH